MLRGLDGNRENSRCRVGKMEIEKIGKFFFFWYACFHTLAYDLSSLNVVVPRLKLDRIYAQHIYFLIELCVLGHTNLTVWAHVSQ